ncbi:MAG: serine/threonine-protein phosphatase [Cryomorphaceae bacterium]|nr:serine/threonine-protein phosphatase [Cryomorphaceae bacterium]
MHFYFKSICGRRAGNEDSCLAEKIADNLYIFAVADGMGGSIGGERASKLAVEELHNLAMHQANNILLGNLPLKDFLRDSFESIDAEIRNDWEINPVFQGMGTTLTAVIILENTMAWASIGDSRLYFSFENEQEFQQQTKDHSLSMQLLENDPNTPIEELLKNDNVITKVLNGMGDKADYYPQDSNYLEIPNNITGLICSDGLILNKFEQPSYLDQFYSSSNAIVPFVNKSIDYAFENGSNDNISMCVFSTARKQNNLLSKLKATFTKK